jgi:hypothetical protein
MAIPNGRFEFKTEGGKMDEQHLDVVVGRPVVEAAPRRVSLRTGLAGWCESLWDFSANWRSKQEPVDVDAGKEGEVIPSTATQVAEQSKTTGVESARANAFVTLDELERACKEEPIAYLVDGLLPAADVHIAVGDSGLGKTPWAYQLGLCVASGRPFLGYKVRQSRVLYYDLENGREEILGLGRSICRHLAIEKFPQDFFILHDNGNAPELASAIVKFRPGLVIVDTLRAFRSDVEGSNEDTGRFLRDVRKIARSSKCALLLLHHIRKHGENDISSLEDTPTLEWLEQAAGARALINQTNTRIAFDRPRRGGDEAAFVMKYFVKLKGESGPIYLGRVCDDDGDPIGYRTIVGVRLLGNPDQEAAFEGLPQQFKFKEAMRVYGKTDDPTSKWLKKCIGANLVRQVARGHYERLV